jgi:hypothetical protein
MCRSHWRRGGGGVICVLENSLCKFDSFDSVSSGRSRLALYWSRPPLLSPSSPRETDTSMSQSQTSRLLPLVNVSTHARVTF